MKKLTDKQLAIYNYIKDNGVVKKAELMTKFNHWYYHNSAKYIGEILFRLVDAKLLSKPKSGYFEINKNYTEDKNGNIN